MGVVVVRRGGHEIIASSHDSWPRISADHHFHKARAVLGIHHAADLQMMGIILLRRARIPAGEGIAIAVEVEFDLPDALRLRVGEMVVGRPFHQLIMQRGTFRNHP